MKKQIRIQKEREILSFVNGIAYSHVQSWYNSTLRDLKLDLILPKRREGHAAQPAVVWLCGGAFSVVDRSVWIPELVTLARAGYTVASVEYRTSNEGGFPMQLIDVKSAIRFLRANAGEFCIDPDRICVMGESAGGTLACLAGLTKGHTKFDTGQNLQVNSDVQAVVDFYGISDFRVLRDGAIEGIPDWAMNAFLGGQSETTDQASMAQYVTQGAPPFLILHGDEDRTVPITQSESLYELLSSKNIDVQLYRVIGASHGDDLFFQEETMQIVLSFLNGHFHCASKI